MKCEVIKDWAHSRAPIVSTQGGGKKRVYKKGTVIDFNLADAQCGIRNGYVKEYSKIVEKATSKVNKQTR
jgi:hypothetical protein